MKIKLFIFLISLCLISLVSAVGTYPSVDPNMVLYYHFNNDSSVGENYGNWTYNLTYDYSNGHLNNGTFKKDVQFNLTNDVLGNGSIFLNGSSNAYVSTPDSLSLNLTDFLICLWVYYPTGSTGGQLVNKGASASYVDNNYGFEVLNGGQLRVSWGNGTQDTYYNSLTSITKDTWNWVCANQTATWINGVVSYDTYHDFDMIGTGGKPAKSPWVLRIGQTGNGQGGFNGSVDDVIVWNASKTDLQINNLYRGYIPKTCYNITEDLLIDDSFSINYLCSQNININDTSSNGVIQIGADNVILDLNGSYIYGNYSQGAWGTPQGINTGGYKNITIQNGRISDYKYGIYATSGTNNSNFINLTLDKSYGGIYFLGGASNNNLTNSTLINNTLASIYNQANGTTIKNCNLINNTQTDGILVDTNIYNTNIINTFFKNNKFSIECKQCQNLTILNSNFTLNRFYNLYAYNSFNNINISNTSFLNGADSIYANNGSNLNSINNYFFNQTTGQFLYLNKINNFSSTNDFFNWTDKAIGIYNIINVKIINASVYNTITNYDGYNSAFDIFNSSGYINNSYLDNVGKGGIIIRKSNLSFNITNTYIDEMSIADKILNKETDYFSTPCAIQLVELFATFDANFDAGNNYTNISQQGVSNVYINNITYGSNVQCMLKLQGTSNITHDTSNYWLRSYGLPYYEDLNYMYLSNNYNNFCGVNGNGITASYQDCRMASGYNNQFKILSNFTKNYDYHFNTNTSQWIFNRANLSSPLITFSNGTSLYQSGTNLEYNLSLSPNEWVYVYNSTTFNTTKSFTDLLAFDPKSHQVFLDKKITNNDGHFNIEDLFNYSNNNSMFLEDFSLNETYRTNSPIWFSYNTPTSKHISSNLTDTVNITIILNATHCNIRRITYSTNSNNYSTVYNLNGTASALSYSCSNKLLTFLNLPVEQASGSNRFDIEYNTEVTESCDALSQGLGKFGMWFGLIALSIIIVIVYSFVVGGKSSEMDGGDLLKKYLLGGIIALVMGGIILIMGLIFTSSMC